MAKIGKPAEGDNYYFQFDVTGNFPKERTPGKDEKPEDKTKLDKEFADNLKKQQDKLKAEQAYTKWTYLVAKYTIDPLLKERKDLLAEKKEEPKKEEAKKAESNKVEPKKEELKTETPSKEEPKKEAVKKDEPKKEEPKNEEIKKDNPSKEETKPEEKK